MAFDGRLSATRAGKLGLNTVFTLGIAVSVIPVLLFILTFGYSRLSAAGRALLEERVAQSQRAIIASTYNFFGVVETGIGAVAQFAAADPNFFRKNESRDILYQTLRPTPQVDALYVSFEDGYHRVVTRIDEDRRSADPRIPPQAMWHSSYVDAYSAGADRRRRRTFFDVWPHVLKAYDEETTLDMPATPQYRLAKERRAFVMTDPSINPDTGYPVIALSSPILVSGASGAENESFIGIVAANVTMQMLSEFLKASQASRNSLTLIVDADGRIFAHPDPENALRRTEKTLEFATLDNAADSRIRQAAVKRRELGRDAFRFTSAEGEELNVSFLGFPAEFGRPWQVVVITPTDDFIGELKATSHVIALVTSLALLLGMLLIYLLSRSLSQSIRSLTRQSHEIQALRFAPAQTRASPIREISDLQQGFALLRNALQTFVQYVPTDLVRTLVSSNQPLGLGVESRNLTVFFSDLENFSTLAEAMDADELLLQVSQYFSTVTGAVGEEGGTVDKFIGDSVMAFWGAPLSMEDHALRACAGALRAARRMERLNREWAREGRAQMRLRIGLNTAHVLVGNVGSSERMSYTAMGDGVNVASRLERMNKRFGTTICIADSVLAAAGARLVVRDLDVVTVKGRSRPFRIYELLGLRDSDDPELAPPPAVPARQESL